MGLWFCLMFFLPPVLDVLVDFFPPEFFSYVYLWQALEDRRKESGSSKLPSLLSKFVPALLLSKDLNAIFFRMLAGLALTRFPLCIIPLLVALFWVLFPLDRLIGFPSCLFELAPVTVILLSLFGFSKYSFTKW